MLADRKTMLHWEVSIASSSYVALATWRLVILDHMCTTSRCRRHEDEFDDFGALFRVCGGDILFTNARKMQNTNFELLMLKLL